MNYTDIIKTVKSRGYWEILFEPTVYQVDKIPLNKCREVVENNSVRLRGWDYPHIPKRTGDDTAFEVGNNYWQGWLDWKGESHKELWRMCQSTQFIHCLCLWEDWADNFIVRSMWRKDDEVFKPGEALGVISTTYLITEIYEFLTRLVKDGLYSEGVTVSLSINNTLGRQLTIESFSRMDFSVPMKTSSKTLTFKKSYTAADIEGSAKELALEAIVHFFERFGWSSPNINVIKYDQENLISGKF